MNELKALFESNAFLRKHIPMQIVGCSFTYVDSKHIVLGDIKRVLHDRGYLLTLIADLSNTEYADTVNSPSRKKYDENQ